MVNELLNMSIGESKIFDFNYDSFMTTKGRLKRNGKGEWQSHLFKGVLTVKRLK